MGAGTEADGKRRGAAMTLLSRIGLTAALIAMSAVLAAIAAAK
jgi:hypothetical protein